MNTSYILQEAQKTLAYLNANGYRAEIRESGHLIVRDPVEPSGYDSNFGEAEPARVKFVSIRSYAAAVRFVMERS